MKRREFITLLGGGGGVAAGGARAAAGDAGDRVPGNGPASSAMGPTSGKAIVASRAERWALIDWFETDCGKSSYPKNRSAPTTSW